MEALDLAAWPTGDRDSEELQLGCDALSGASLTRHRRIVAAISVFSLLPKHLVLLVLQVANATLPQVRRLQDLVELVLL